VFFLAVVLTLHSPINNSVQDIFSPPNTGYQVVEEDPADEEGNEEADSDEDHDSANKRDFPTKDELNKKLKEKQREVQNCLHFLIFYLFIASMLFYRKTKGEVKYRKLLMSPDRGGCMLRAIS
jgi:hypothetical protein